MLTADQYDLTHAAHAKKNATVKPYPRPWPDKATKRIGGKNTVRRSAAQVHAILRPNAPSS